MWMALWITEKSCLALVTKGDQADKQNLAWHPQQNLAWHPQGKAKSCLAPTREKDLADKDQNAYASGGKPAARPVRQDPAMWGYGAKSER